MGEEDQMLLDLTFILVKKYETMGRFGAPFVVLHRLTCLQDNVTRVWFNVQYVAAAYWYSLIKG